jgi:hypothetical protein
MFGFVDLLLVLKKAWMPRLFQVKIAATHLCDVAAGKMRCADAECEARMSVYARGDLELETKIMHEMVRMVGVVSKGSWKGTSGKTVGAKLAVINPAAKQAKYWFCQGQIYPPSFLL